MTRPLQPGNAALIVVDGINAFFSRSGSLHYPAVEATVDPIRALLDRARSRGDLVVHAVERHRRGFDDLEARRLPEHCPADSEDAAIFPAFAIAPGGREVELPKRRFSAFFGTDLALLLREQSTETVVLCGCKTNVCVRATAQDAFAWGYSVVVPEAATSSNRPHLAQASLEDIDRYMGRVVSLAEALELL